jgi:hypothetical protein
MHFYAFAPRLENKKENPYEKENFDPDDGNSACPFGSADLFCLPEA